MLRFPCKKLYNEVLYKVGYDAHFLSISHLIILQKIFEIDLGVLLCRKKAIRR